MIDKLGDPSAEYGPILFTQDIISSAAAPFIEFTRALSERVVDHGREGSGIFLFGENEIIAIFATNVTAIQANDRPAGSQVFEDLAGEVKPILRKTSRPGIDEQKAPSHDLK